MQKIRMLKSGEVREVSNSEAHRLIETKVAELFRNPPNKMAKKKEQGLGKGNYGASKQRLGKPGRRQSLS